MPEAVVSTIGQDRPGLVNDLSELVAAEGLNITDSRMTVLGGEFAVLMGITGDDAALDAFAEKLAALAQRQQLAHLFRKTASREIAAALPYHGRVVAMDHPGIVRRIAGFFSEREVNIRDLTTTTGHAPHTGTPIFDLNMQVEIPAAKSIPELREAFEGFCRDEDLDVEMRST